MRTIPVELSDHSYPILIENGLLNNANLLQKYVHGRQLLIVSNKRVAKHYLPTLKSAFQNYQCDVLLLRDGEKYKTLKEWAKIFDVLLKNHHHRSTTLIALGGGVVGDITGFAAACYQRGANFMQIPTTLLAQVDASIGGKTGVNHPLGKNMIGAFYQPQCVIIDTQTLVTLPDRELSAGLAEIIKAALIADADFFAWLEQNMARLLLRDPISLLYAIEKACSIKADIVRQDPQEQTNIRALLNLGHTFGHALEYCLGYGHWLHGEAVSLGLVLAAEMSHRLMGLLQTEVERVKQILLSARLPILLPNELEYQKLLDAMLLDKKTTDAGVRLILLKTLGNAVLTTEVKLPEITKMLMEFAV